MAKMAVLAAAQLALTASSEDDFRSSAALYAREEPPSYAACSKGQGTAARPAQSR